VKKKCFTKKKKEEGDVKSLEDKYKGKKVSSRTPK
jgi:hypothetical protein